MHFTGLTNISAHVVQKLPTNILCLTNSLHLCLKVLKITKINGQSHQNCYSMLDFLICLLYNDKAINNQKNHKMFTTCCTWKLQPTAISLIITRPYSTDDTIFVTKLNEHLCLSDMRGHSQCHNLWVVVVNSMTLSPTNPHHMMQAGRWGGHIVNYNYPTVIRQWMTHTATLSHQISDGGTGGWEGHTVNHIHPKATRQWMTHTVTLNHWISGGGTASMAGHAMTTESPSITSTLLFPESITDGGTAKIMCCCCS